MKKETAMSKAPVVIFPQLNVITFNVFYNGYSTSLPQPSAKWMASRYGAV